MFRSGGSCAGFPGSSTREGGDPLQHSGSVRLHFSLDFFNHPAEFNPMPVEFKMHSEKRQIHTRATGLITVDELEHHMSEMRKLVEQGVLDHTWGQLIHFDHVHFTHRHPATVVKSLAKNNPWPEGSPRVVVTENKFVFALCRMYQQLAYSDQDGIRVMQSLDKAQEYLDSCFCE